MPNKKIKIVVKILRYHGNKKSTISGYTLHVIWKAVNLLSATVHINSIYKFEIIHIKPSNANQKINSWFRIFFTMAIQMSDGQLPHIKQYSKVKYLPSANVYMSNTYKV